MWTLIRNGGVIPMMFILILGLLSLGSAFYFAVRPQQASLGFIETMSRATLFGTLAATAAAVGATLTSVGKVWDQPPPEGGALFAMRILVEGLAESTSAGIMGFALLALVWMLTAVGRRRLDERRSGP